MNNINEVQNINNEAQNAPQSEQLLQSSLQPLQPSVQLPAQTSATIYEYNYTYIEPAAMVAALPPNETFSQSWLVLTGMQIIKLAINTLIANQGDRGQPGATDDVQAFLRRMLLKTLQEEGPEFQLKLVAALKSLLPPWVQQMLDLQKATRGMGAANPAAPMATPAVGEVTQKVKEALEKLLQSGSSPEMAVAVAASQSVEMAVAAVPPAIVAPGTDIQVQVTPIRTDPDAPSQPVVPMQVNVEVATSDLAIEIERALKQPLRGIPSNEAEVQPFVASNLLKVLGEGFLQPFAQNIVEGLKEKAPAGRPSSLEDYRKLFAYVNLPEIADTFQDDVVFAYLRVAGPNPIMIQRLTTPDPRFPVTEEQYQAVMGPADSLQTAMDEGRVYLADFAILDGALGGTYGTQPQTQKYLYAPLALFAVPAAGAVDRLLRPVAIQCGQSPAEYPVITPATGANAWLMAKTVVQIADTNVHEAVSHFARTHLLIEPFVIATHRQLAPTHPLFQLLVPHFQGTLAINNSAHQFLVAPRGGVNGLLSSTIDNSRVLIVRGFQARGFNADMLPRRLQDRGVADSEGLPVYPYRDDGLLIWKAIHDWVEAYLRLFYDSDQAVQSDQSVQQWAAELVAFDGGRLTDFGDAGDGQIATFAYLVDAVTMVIFTGSAQHAAVNFPQSGIMSFAPAVPTAGYRSAKGIGPDSTYQDWLDLLPPLDQAQHQLNLLTLLGSVYFTKLGDYEENHFSDARVNKPLQAFQQRLQEINQIIDRRNQERPVYEYLKPAKIPQSINI